MILTGIWQADRTAADYARVGSAWIYALLGLGMLAVFLMAALATLEWCTVRIYNWNGQRYCYLGRVALRRNGGVYLVRIKERMADLSNTTLYQICPSKHFVRRNRYKDMMLCAGNASCLLHVDGCLRQSIYYKA